MCSHKIVKGITLGAPAGFKHIYAAPKSTSITRFTIYDADGLVSIVDGLVVMSVLQLLGRRKSDLLPLSLL